MSLPSKIGPLFQRFGPAARRAIKIILSTALPGSAAVVELIDALVEYAGESETGSAAAAAYATSEDLQRVEAMLDIVTGDLQTLMGQVAALEAQPHLAQQIVQAAWHTDERYRAALHQLDRLAQRFDRLEQQNRQLLRDQGFAVTLMADLLPLLRRQAGVADVVEELQALPSGPFTQQLQQFQQGIQCLHQHQTAQAERLLADLAAQQPQAAAVVAALAAAQATGQAFQQAQHSLTRAAQLQPDDGELAELCQRVTRLSRHGNAETVAPAGEAGLQVGGQVDGWRLEQLLGCGGWGRVFRASKNGQTAALKILHPELSRDPQFVERFKQEIMTLIRLGSHPHLVEIYNFGCDASSRSWYFLMELVEGISLEHYLAKRGALSLKSAQRVFLAVADGLAQAHRQGITHRDIKPLNILLRRNGQPVLVDFGLSTFARKAMVPVSPAGSGYTTMFAAPEQLRGKTVDERSDVYSLAGSLYYALTYDNPRYREPEFFDAGLAALEVRNLLIRALHPHPDQRHQDADEFRQDLRATEGRLELFVSLPGKWLARSAGSERERWHPAFSSPGLVRLQPGEHYCFQISPAVTDDKLEELNQLRGLAALSGLSLQDCRQLTDAALAELRGFPQLRSLFLTCCPQFTEAGFSQLRCLGHLHILDLRGCDRLTDAGLKQLQWLPRLRSLSLNCCYRITDSGLAQLARLTSLQALDLRSCHHLTPSAVERLQSHLPTCKILR